MIVIVAVGNLLPMSVRAKKNSKPKLIVVVGPTASGKSGLAVDIARDLKKRAVGGYAGAEIISADSRQIYQGLNIGSGKITHKEMMGIPHHLLDVFNPKARQVFTVADFKRLAHAAITDIVARGNVPILVGGTGFYIQAVVDNIELPDVPPNKKLRVKLETFSTEKLLKTLEKLDAKRARGIDANNRPRLVRAIEIATALGKVPGVKAKPLYDVLQIGIATDEKKLRANIHDRLLARIKKGMVREVRALHAGGVSWKRLHDFGLEYRHIAAFLRGNISRSEMLAELEKEIWHYAKRQMTWFKKDTRIWWLPLSKKTIIKKTVYDFLK